MTDQAPGRRIWRGIAIATGFLTLVLSAPVAGAAGVAVWQTYHPESLRQVVLQVTELTHVDTMDEMFGNAVATFEGAPEKRT